MADGFISSKNKSKPIINKVSSALVSFCCLNKRWKIYLWFFIRLELSNLNVQLVRIFQLQRTELVFGKLLISLTFFFKNTSPELCQRFQSKLLKTNKNPLARVNGIVFKKNCKYFSASVESACLRSSVYKR